MPVPVPLQTAIISAATAAAVTLVLDVLIRPYLEVRKDRIVSKARDKRDLIASLRASISQTSHVTTLWATNAEKLRESIASTTDQIAKVESSRLPERRRLACTKMLMYVRARLSASLLAIETCERLVVDLKDRNSGIDLVAKQLYSDGVELVNLTILTLRLTTLRRWKPFEYYRVLKKAEILLCQIDERAADAVKRPVVQSASNDHST